MPLVIVTVLLHLLSTVHLKGLIVKNAHLIRRHL